MSATNFDTVGTKVVTKTAAFTADANAEVYLCSTTGGAYAATLPSAASSKVYSSGRAVRLTFKRTTATANAVTVTAVGSETIDGSGTYALSAQYATVTVVSDGTNWQIVSKF